MPHTGHSKAFCQTETIVQDSLELAAVLALRRVKASSASCSVSSLNKGECRSKTRAILNLDSGGLGIGTNTIEDDDRENVKRKEGMSSEEQVAQMWPGDAVREARGGLKVICIFRKQVNHKLHNLRRLPTNLILNNPACKVNCQGAPSGEEYRQQR